jgi:phospholipid-binding lipoprotein MlaA
MAPVILVLGLFAAIGMGSAAWTETSEEPAPVIAAAPEAPAPKDPWRRFNRRSYAFNGFLDRVLVRPVTRAYMRITPSPLRRGLGNVVSNLREPSTVVNDVLQGRPKRAVKATARLLVNSTVGVLGLFDVATHAGLEKHRSDFGQTLGRYGAGPGPYLYLPLVGPLNLRDGVGGVVDVLTDPVSLATGGLGSDFGVGRLGVTALDGRAGADSALEALANDSADPYAATRAAYLQLRDATVRESTGETEILPDFDLPPDGAPEGSQTPPAPDDAAPGLTVADLPPPATPASPEGSL